MVALAALVLACGAGTAGTSTFRFGDNTPDDLRALASETMADVAAALPARTHCLAGVELEGAWELDDRAQYDPGRSRITVRIPATASHLEASLVHELAHHLEFTCSEQVDARVPFLQATGAGPDDDWFGGGTWEETPSEQWASAMVLYVLDRPDERSRIAIDAKALDAVHTWATGT